jgi:hypothetical protein
MIHINRAKYENFISNTNPKTFMNWKYKLI